MNDQKDLDLVDGYWRLIEKSDENLKRVAGDDDQLAVAPAIKGFDGAKRAYAGESENVNEQEKL